VLVSFAYVLACRLLQLVVLGARADRSKDLDESGEHHAAIDAGPAVAARLDGSRKMPEPTMFPITSAVAIPKPSSRFSVAGCGRDATVRPAGRFRRTSLRVSVSWPRIVRSSRRPRRESPW
jgi:hypothetical protein